MCAAPFDLCGPVIREGSPPLGFCERHNSVLSPGTYSVASDVVTTEQVIDTPIDGQPIQEPVEQVAPPARVEPPRPMIAPPVRNTSAPRRTR